MTDWTTLRTHFKAQLAASGLTQAEVARRGGLSGQNAISKLLANTRRGPSVETWLRALKGLGLTLDDVVANLEVPVPGTLSLRERIHALETAHREEIAALRRRAHAESSPVSPPDPDILDARITPAYPRQTRSAPQAIY